MRRESPVVMRSELPNVLFLKGNSFYYIRQIGINLSGSNFKMKNIQQVEDMLSTLTRPEKAELLQWVVQDLSDSFPGIESTPGISGGEPRIVRTRIPIWLLEQARRLGASDGELLRSYPTLRAEDLANAWAYVRSHRHEIDQQIKENEEA